MVNGAGLAMATMDIIKYAGGRPANFLDVGGGANAEQVKNAFRILLSDPNVKAVLINIFGGILRVDTLATGVVAAARRLNIQLPIVVRLEGTNVELGRKILKESRLEFHRGGDHEGRGGESCRCREGRADNEHLWSINHTRLLVQGLTGREGTFHAKSLRAYGTKVVGGVTPGKGGTTHEGWPVFNTVAKRWKRPARMRP